MMESHRSAARVLGGLALLYLVGAIVMPLMAWRADLTTFEIVLNALYMLVRAIGCGVVAFFAWRANEAARVLAIIIAVLTMFWFPVGTVIGIYLVIVSARPWRIVERPRMSSASLAAAFPTPRDAAPDREAATGAPEAPASVPGPPGDRPA